MNLYTQINLELKDATETYLGQYRAEIFPTLALGWYLTLFHLKRQHGKKDTTDVMASFVSVDPLPGCPFTTDDLNAVILDLSRSLPDFHDMRADKQRDALLVYALEQTGEFEAGYERYIRMLFYMSFVWMQQVQWHRSKQKALDAILGLLPQEEAIDAMRFLSDAEIEFQKPRSRRSRYAQVLTEEARQKLPQTVAVLLDTCARYALDLSDEEARRFLAVPERMSSILEPSFHFFTPEMQNFLKEHLPTPLAADLEGCRKTETVDTAALALALSGLAEEFDRYDGNGGKL